LGKTPRLLALSNEFGEPVSLGLATGQTDMSKRRDEVKPCKSVCLSSKGGVIRHARTLEGGFTLTELLITLLVVGVLAALLLPALNGSKGRAREARCISNLRQIYTGVLLYHSDHDQFPGRILRQGKTWTSATFIGGTAGRDSNAPLADMRPLYSYVAKGEVFWCPADVGIRGTNKWSVSLEPSLFDVWGVSYWYHAGRYDERLANFIEGLGGKRMEWVQRPSAYVLAAEPPAVAGGTRSEDGQRMDVY
jgi:prepilin-type N-terminal cleavage/methylation domain-containing protein